MNKAWIAGGLAVSGLWGMSMLSACGPGACGATYPEAPSGSGPLLYVSAACADPAPDGTIDHPYPTIGDAINAAAAGSAILVEGGVYPENLTIEKPLAIIGGSGESPDDAAIILQAEEDNAIVVQGAQGVTVQGVVIEGSKGIGVWAYNAQLTLKGSRIKDTAANAEGAFGWGVLAQDDASIILQNNEISGSKSQGVLVSASEAAYIVQNQIHDNEKGGVRLEGALGEAQIQGNQIVDNIGAGIFVGSSVAYIVQNNLISGTLDFPNEPGLGGDGIVVTEALDKTGTSLGPSEAHIQDSVITGNARTGILGSGDIQGYIVQNSLGSNGVAAASAMRFGAGVWLQKGAGVGGEDVDPASVPVTAGIVMDSNTFENNAALAAGVSSKSRVLAKNNTVKSVAKATLLADISLEPVDVGDGFGIFYGASIDAAKNDIQGCPRSGIFIDSPTPTLVRLTNNHLEKFVEAGIILQNVGPDPLDLTGNTFDDPDPMKQTLTVPKGTFDFSTLAVP